MYVGISKWDKFDHTLGLVCISAYQSNRFHVCLTTYQSIRLSENSAKVVCLSIFSPIFLSVRLSVSAIYYLLKAKLLIDFNNESNLYSKQNAKKLIFPSHVKNKSKQAEDEIANFLPNEIETVRATTESFYLFNFYSLQIFLCFVLKENKSRNTLSKCSYFNRICLLISRFVYGPCEKHSIFWRKGQVH